MRCANCGYFNIPGAQTCGRCGRSLTPETTTTPPAFEEIYPPRAKQRTIVGHLENRMMGQIRAGRRAALAIDNRRRMGAASICAARHAVLSAARTGTPIGDQLRPWGAVYSAILPGMGHVVQGRDRPAVRYLLATAALVLIGLADIHNPLSNMAAFAMVALMVVSVYDVSNVAFPAMATDPASMNLRTMRLVFLSLFTIASVIFSIYWVLSIRFPVYTMATDQASPAIEAGDVLLGHQIGLQAQGLVRGDVVMANNAQDFLIVERILGLPGDDVASDGQTISVDGHRLPANMMPLGYRGKADVFDMIVPKDKVCVWQMNAGQFDDDNMPVARANAPARTAVTIDDSDIRARVIAICDPPSRRRWL